MFVSNCAIFVKRKSMFITNQEVSGLLSKLKIRNPLSNIQLIGNILF